MDYIHYSKVVFDLYDKEKYLRCLSKQIIKIFEHEENQCVFVYFSNVFSKSKCHA